MFWDSNVNSQFPCGLPLALSLTQNELLATIKAHNQGCQIDLCANSHPHYQDPRLPCGLSLVILRLFNFHIHYYLQFQDLLTFAWTLAPFSRTVNSRADFHPLSRDPGLPCELPPTLPRTLTCNSGTFQLSCKLSPPPLMTHPQTPLWTQL
jgi:hypothetical protein